MKWVLSVVQVRDAPRSVESKAPIKERSISRPPLPNGGLLLNHDKWLSNKPQTNPTHFDLKCCQVKGATHKAIWGFFPPSRKAFLHQECLIQLQMARMIVEQLTHFVAFTYSLMNSNKTQFFFASSRANAEKTFFFIHIPPLMTQLYVESKSTLFEVRSTEIVKY